MSGSVSFSLPSITLSYLGTDAFSGKEGEEVAAQRLARKWDENSPPPLFKEGAQQLRKGERLGRKTLYLPLFNANAKSMLTEIQGDAPEPTGHALVDKTSPGQIGHCLGMARH